MLPRLVLLAPLIAALGFAQADWATNQKTLEELRMIRGSLERLERSQRALLALSRIQVDQSQILALEAQAARLSAQERDLSRQVADSSRVVSGPAPMVQTTEGTTEPAARGDDAALKTRLAADEAALDEVQRKKQSVEQEIARLKGRIAAAEKLVDEILSM